MVFMMEASQQQIHSGQSVSSNSNNSTSSTTGSGSTSLSASNSDNNLSAMANQAGGNMPSPQSVGREFVRQYYTLLNRAPLHLHRFYTNDSSFVHGVLDKPGSPIGVEAEPVYGQEKIHQKIMQLNFRECHAKIRQVDAHSTLGKGVVVQVLGELSNNGGSLRRFVQTFVLAMQNPKKYYVRNDIFRYQDEVFVDMDNGTSPTPTPIENEDQDVLEKDEKTLVNGQGSEKGTTDSGAFSSPSSSDVINVSVNPRSSPVQGPADTSILQEAEEEESISLEQPKDSVAEDEILTSSNAPVTEVEEKVDESLPSSLRDNESPAKVIVQAEDVVEAPTKTEAKPAENPQASKPEPAPAPAAPLSYANRLKLSSASVSVAPATKGNSGNTKQDKEVAPNAPSSITSPAAYGSGSNSKGSWGRPGNNARGGGMNRGGSGNSGSFRGDGYNNRDSNSMSREATSSESQSHQGGGEGTAPNAPEQRRTRMQSMGGGSNVMYPDSVQVFVGNLPHNRTESDLSNLFSQFGKVVEVRIHHKGANVSKSLPSGPRVPNFAFVVFEDEKSVQDCLRAIPIYLPPDNHRLNVEEKKNKARQDGQNSYNSNNNFVQNNSQNSQRSFDGPGRGIDRSRGGLNTRGGSSSGRGGGSLGGQKGSANGAGPGSGPSGSGGYRKKPSSYANSNSHPNASN